VARVFISYARDDRTLADEVRRWLVEAGHEVFLHQDLWVGIAPGEEWEQRHLETVLAGHPRYVSLVAFAPDGRTW
jgi:hypothetical protein